MKVQKATFRDGPELQDSRFAPYAGDRVFIIDRDILIHNDEIINDFDVEFYSKAFKLRETVESKK